MRELPLPTFPVSSLGTPATPRRSLHRRPRPDAAPVGKKASFDVVWTRDEKDVLHAQQLRHLVFVEEMGARLSAPAGSAPRHDIDMFDPYCEHLLVRARGTEDDGPVIGTYRVLTPASARRASGFSSDIEFDLTRLRPLRAKMVELDQRLFALRRQGTGPAGLGPSLQHR